MTLVLLVGVCLHLSQEQSQAEDEVRILAEDVAILRAEMSEVRQQLDASTTRGGSSDPAAH
jgi:hypothetical protein